MVTVKFWDGRAKQIRKHQGQLRDLESRQQSIDALIAAVEADARELNDKVIAAHTEFNRAKGAHRQGVTHRIEILLEKVQYNQMRGQSAVLASKNITSAVGAVTRILDAFRNNLEPSLIDELAKDVEKVILQVDRTSLATRDLNRVTLGPTLEPAVPEAAAIKVEGTPVARPQSPQKLPESITERARALGIDLEEEAVPPDELTE